MSQNPINIYFRIIYLWAFVETGLGGILHLFHIPLTGLFIGGFSILINILLAKHTHIHAKSMLSALGIVLLSKFTLSPQSPVGAYIAVGFQGLFALFIFKLFGVNKLSAVLYAIIVMVENAIQKPLIGYLFFHKEIVKGIEWSSKQFFESPELILNLFIGIGILYFLGYILWGGILGLFSIELISKLNNYNLPSDFYKMKLTKEIDSNLGSRTKILPLILGIIVFILLVIMTSLQIISYFVIVKIGILLIFFTWVFPYILSKILLIYKNKHTESIQEVIKFLPQIRLNFIRSYHYSKRYTGWTRWKEFVFLSIYLSIFTEDE